MKGWCWLSKWVKREKLNDFRNEYWFLTTTNKAPEMPKCESPEHELIEAMQVLTLQEGDTVVLSVKHRMTEQCYLRLKEEWEAQWKGHAVVPKILILEDGATIGVVRKEVEMNELEDAMLTPCVTCTKKTTCELFNEKYTRCKKHES